MGLVNRGWVPEQGHHALQQGTPRLAAGDTPRPRTGRSIYRVVNSVTKHEGILDFLHLLNCCGAFLSAEAVFRSNAGS